MSLEQRALGVFPEDEKIAQAFKDNRIKYLGNIAGLIRDYPPERQAAFLARVLEDRYTAGPYFIRSERDVSNSIELPLSQVPRPNIEGTATLMTEINLLPLRSGELSIEEMKKMAEECLAACNYHPRDQLTIRIETRPEHFEELKDVILNLQDEVATSAQIFGRVEGHPLWVAHYKCIELADSVGLNGFVNRLADHSGDWFVSAAVRQMFDGQRRLGIDFWNRNRDFKVHGAPFYINQSLSYALAFESMKELMRDQGYLGNPFRVSVDMLRPTLWPMGFEGNNFWVFKYLAEKSE